MQYEQFIKDLNQLGIHSGDVLMVHSSMQALGTTMAPEEVIHALEDVIGPEGTLLMPALTYENVNHEHPEFISDQTEPCVGRLPTTFWRLDGTERSINPTHSVCARGKLAHTLTVGHAMDNTAVGVHSPFMLLPLYQGKILFIGDILESCTFMHGVEDLVNPPYIRRVKQNFMVNGVEREYIINDDYGWGSEFQRIEDILEYPDIRKGKLLNANGHLIDSRALFAAATSKMRAEPYAFITDISQYI